MLVHAIRFKPGQDLKRELINFVTGKRMEAAWIMSGLGSLTETNIRYANQREGRRETGYFEILSLTGTLSVHGCHIH